MKCNNNKKMGKKYTQSLQQYFIGLCSNNEKYKDLQAKIGIGIR